ncbi:Serine carboxypeptidase-like 18 [Platanthera guangdongensis]|uniref:Serine carboxypeptidase-like 18 n=1 Tax=Platanthera guangdongensis TaxID=2320717 RepID=A0ABR2LCY9_9ASPA
MTCSRDSLLLAGIVTSLLFLRPFLLPVSAAKLTTLPGFNGALPFRLETGYTTVNEVSGAELFYYFVPSERNPSKDPVLIWLSGGPGCSAFSAFAMDMGPVKFNVDYFDGNMPSLVANPYSWTMVSNMIFLDWPIGTGFSYSKNADDYEAENVNTKELIYKFLRKWFLDHPQYISNPFYLGGDSYGAKMTAFVAHEIAEGNENGQQPVINLKGYVIGNGRTGELIEASSEVVHAHDLAIISDELYELIQTNCVGEDYFNPKNAVCATHLDTFNAFLSEINSYNVLELNCPEEPPKNKQFPRAHRSLEESSVELFGSSSDAEPDCISAPLLCYYWGNNNVTRKALHIKEGTLGEFHRCKWDLNYTQTIVSSVPYHHNLLSRGYRALIYNGDHDLRIPFIATLTWIKSLNFSVLEEWRSWKVDSQVAGYTMLFSNNLTYATVKGGSHTAPDNRPKQTLAMFQRWADYESL